MEVMFDGCASRRQAMRGRRPDQSADLQFNRKIPIEPDSFGNNAQTFYIATTHYQNARIIKNNSRAAYVSCIARPARKAFPSEAGPAVNGIRSKNFRIIVRQLIIPIFKIIV
ncbi:hypothetical protein [Burkholderia stagnalis]|uniref:hypothetical protein n=1 Tax=Burkholderia stagnalis TaxID=1503054 RepID=UPI0012D9AC43|nr:hypothetical protein [Burkholderia stagnalis]